MFFFNGGMGGTQARNGNSTMSWPSNVSPTPVEIAERDAPFKFLRKALLRGTGGAGSRRGGDGQEITFQSVHDSPMSVVFLTERVKHAAPGLCGGGDGACGAVLINGEPVDSRRQHLINPGDVVTLKTPGGGGFGRAAQSPASQH